MNKKILLADDSVTIQRVVELTFAGQGYDVTCLRSGREVVDVARSLRPDVVLLDVSLPEENGYDVCQQLKKEQELGEVPVMLLTGTFEPFDGDRARTAGASAHLTKPFESQVLVERVSELIHNPFECLLPPPRPEPPRVEAVAEPTPEPERPEPQAPPPVPEAEAPTSAPVLDMASLSPEALDLIAQRVVQQLSDAVVREVAWEVVPELAERLVRQRIRQIEEEAG
jgi:CheY-like chemotaxis protein